MLFVHCSSDQILLCDDSQHIVIPFEDIERTFPVALYAIFDPSVHTDILVINGPGSFTQLRVATVSLNLLNQIQHNTLTFIDIPKIGIYKNLAKKSKLPRRGVVFMGQRKNMRLVDCLWDEPDYQMVDSATVLEILWERDYFVDRVDHPVVEMLDRSRQISAYGIHQQRPYMVYAWEEIDIDTTDADRTSIFSPRYMMDPQIG